MYKSRKTYTELALKLEDYLIQHIEYCRCKVTWEDRRDMSEVDKAYEAGALAMLDRISSFVEGWSQALVEQQMTARYETGDE